MNDARESHREQAGYAGRRSDALTSRGRSLLSLDCISDSQAAVLRWFARVWTLVWLAGFGASLYWRDELFRDARGTWQQPILFGLLAIIALGWLLAWKWEWLGASMILAGASGFGILAAIQNQPIEAFVPFAAFLVPAIIHWLCWQRRQPVRTLLGLAVVLTAMIAAGGLAASHLYIDYFGPTHPASETALEPPNLVNWAWSGAAGTDSIVVKAQLLVEPASTRLAISGRSDLTGAIYVDGSPTGGDDNPIYSYAIDDLQPDSEYHYAVEVDGELDSARRGRFRTYPEGPASFSFVFGSCASTGSNGAVFDAIRESNPLFLLHTGDFYYGDIEENDPGEFIEEMTRSLTAPAQSALYRSTPIAYIWDDHDYGPANSDRTSPSREASQSAYGAVVPHYPLESSTDGGSIYQAFTVGRARFIVTDLRSQRDPASLPDGPDKSMMGDEQKTWFKQQLLDAKDSYPLIFWVSAVPWISEPGAGRDDWGGYATERAEIASFIADNDIEGLIVLGGDAHMVAIDDGINSNYASTPGPGFPVFHAAAFDRRGSITGGPYSEGTFPGGGRFGQITVTDDGGDRIQITMTGRTWDGETLVSHTVTFDAPLATDPWEDFFLNLPSGEFTPD